MKKLLGTLLILLLFATACKKDKDADPDRKPDETYNPVILAENFTNSTDITNTYMRYDIGKKYIYEGETEDGLERIEVQRLTETKVVMGITCVVVNDKVWLEDALIEDTDDWFAQDNDGNVWYFGEEVDNYNDDGTFKDHEGAWEAGVDGAKPGIVMLADPQKGMAYREEYYFNEAEDEAEIIDTGLTVEVPYGTFENCIKTRNWTELEPDVEENKFYAPGIGVIKEINIEDNEEITLTEIEE